MVYMVTFTINIPPMLVYIPYMDPMGNVSLYRIFWVFVFTTSGWCFEICVFFRKSDAQGPVRYVKARWVPRWVLGHPSIKDPQCMAPNTYGYGSIPMKIPFLGG